MSNKDERHFQADILRGDANMKRTILAICPFLE